MYISRKQKYLVVIPLLIISAVFGVWLTRSKVETMVTIRSDNSTLVKDLDAPDQSAESPTESVVTSAPEPKPEPTLPAETLDVLGLNGDEEEVIYFAYDTIPNDPIYPQWYTTIIGAPSGWDTTTGSTDTVVAVIDSGFALDHEDLSSAWWLNDGEQGQTQLGDVCWSGTAADKQTNNCDDDDNGYIDDWRGWDFSNNDNNPQAGEDSSGATHGSKVAGLVGGRGNNAIGTASVNWNTKIMPLQGLYDDGYGFSSDIAAAIVYAVDHSADVINLSLGSPSPDSIIRSAVQYADSQNVIVVTSSGNCGEEQTSPQCTGYPSPGGMGYPARYPETIAVGATTSLDERASFSSYGAELDIVAPGSGSIQTTSWSITNQTSEYSLSAYGTSFASPIVAGYVASIKAVSPDLSRSEVLALIKQSAEKPTGMGGEDRTDFYGWGRINIDLGFDEVDDYAEAIEKASDPAIASVAPQISTNIGHSSDSAVSSSGLASTYCVTAPDTICELVLKRQGSATSTSLGEKMANSQGIAVWNWNTDDLSSSGTYDATVTAGSLVSTVEVIIVN